MWSDLQKYIICFIGEHRFYLRLRVKSFSYFRCVFSLCRCCLWCLEKFLRFINYNAYIMCAMKVKISSCPLHTNIFCSEYKLLFICQCCLQVTCEKLSSSGCVGQVITFSHQVICFINAIFVKESVISCCSLVNLSLWSSPPSLHIWPCLARLHRLGM